MRPRAMLGAVAGVLVGVAAATGADAPVTAKKLVVVDKTLLAGSAKIVYVAKDQNVAKGVGTSVDTIDVSFDVTYAGAGSWRAASSFRRERPTARTGGRSTGPPSRST